MKIATRLNAAPGTDLSDGIVEISGCGPEVGFHTAPSSTCRKVCFCYPEGRNISRAVVERPSHMVKALSRNPERILGVSDKYSTARDV